MYYVVDFCQSIIEEYFEKIANMSEKMTSTSQLVQKKSVKPFPNAWIVLLWYKQNSTYLTDVLTGKNNILINSLNKKRDNVSKHSSSLKGNYRIWKGLSDSYQLFLLDDVCYYAATPHVKSRIIEQISDKKDSYLFHLSFSPLTKDISQHKIPTCCSMYPAFKRCLLCCNVNQLQVSYILGCF